MTDDRLADLVDRYLATLAAGGEPDLDALVAEAGDLADDLLAILGRHHAAHPADVDAAAVVPLGAPTFGDVLAAARERRGLLRRDLVDRLVEALGLPAAARARIDARLHDVESGVLPGSGVAARVVDALAAIAGCAPGALAGAAPAPPAPVAVFHRPAPGHPAPAAADGSREGQPEPDAVAAEVDALFGAPSGRSGESPRL